LIVPKDFKPILMNKFGDWFLRSPNDEVFFLCLVEGELTKIAPSENEFFRLVNTSEKQGEWFLDGFIFRCQNESFF